MLRAQAVGLAGTRPSIPGVAAPHSDFEVGGALRPDASEAQRRGVKPLPPSHLSHSVTENSAWTERVVQNFSPLSESPSSVARAIRESYGRYVSARPRRFHAHA